MNLRDQILSSHDSITRRVETPEWKCGHVYVRTLSHAERRRLFADHAKKDQDIYLANLAVAIICDEDGSRAFKDEDAKLLMEKSGPVLDRCVNEWMKLNAIDPD